MNTTSTHSLQAALQLASERNETAWMIEKSSDAEYLDVDRAWFVSTADVDSYIGDLKNQNPNSYFRAIKQTADIKTA